MPTLRLLTNVEIAAEDHPLVMAELSQRLAELLGKPESYVMLILEPGRNLLFAGTAAPAAYLELKSLGLAETQTSELSRRLCEWLEARLAIPANRVYIEFANPPRQMFGWNKGTF
ncbi:hypothetical protein GWK36_13625 [Caldichromatium japonicum]|uniref:L-dopachrome isomerase n=1 Tax=Caldichromatium japonicum TaxID=2699430 RepID=A0A6G7VG51_9GAMM|nr:phenylpyruvate tautomerase MIF-related protein [Caldichromatium japonicum]QIK38845.1 hypothetical protein GWK36_13625 [Caldichromatium japonicum]